MKCIGGRALSQFCLTSDPTFLFFTFANIKIKNKYYPAPNYKIIKNIIITIRPRLARGYEDGHLHDSWQENYWAPPGSVPGEMYQEP